MAYFFNYILTKLRQNLIEKRIAFWGCMTLKNVV